LLAAAKPRVPPDVLARVSERSRELRRWQKLLDQAVYISLSEVANAENFSKSWSGSTAMKPAAYCFTPRQP
jgi:hypothetical protein